MVLMRTTGGSLVARPEPSAAGVVAASQRRFSVLGVADGCASVLAVARIPIDTFE